MSSVFTKLGRRSGFSCASTSTQSSVFTKLVQLATGSTGPHKAKPPAGIRQYNDSVWIFNNPKFPDVDIIFFHGLQIGDFEDAFWKSWQDRTNTVVWPKDWLSKKLPNARILSISYNSSATRLEDQLDYLGQNLIRDIILDSRLDVGHNRPVFLVGHCLGGTIIKQFILSAVKQLNSSDGENDQTRFDRLRTFMENLKGVFYYATPHAGSEVADCKLTDLAANLVSPSPILGLLKTLDTARQRINESFRRLQKVSNSHSFAVVEGLPTSYMWFNGRFVVGRYSATQNVDAFYTSVTADHFAVCKARNENDKAVIVRLVEFIIDAAPEVRCATDENFRVSIRDPILPEGLTEEAKLNDSVWKLYSPDEGEADVDIILFHGLQTGDYEEAFWKTWLAKNETQLVWPKDWLSKSLPNARIFSVSYNSIANKGGDSNQGDIELLAGGLLDDIILARRHDIGQQCPVFLVGHCLGGIVIQQFISWVSSERFSTPKDSRSENEQWKLDRVNRFLENLKGVFFYGTPNGGVPDEVTALANLCTTNRSPILSLLKTLDAERRIINEKFRLLRLMRRIPTFGIAEKRPTNCEGFHGVVVPGGSARHGIDGYYTYETADHFTVCQARTMTDPTVIKKLLDFISNAARAIKLRNPGEADREATILQ